MNVKIELFAAQWHDLLGRLDPNSSAFSVVKSAIEINEAPATTPLGRVTLICDEFDARTLLDAAREFAPDVVPTIHTALNLQ
jgi:hypothetical protein